VSRDRCYDFLNIFAKKIGEHIGVLFAQTATCFWKNLIITLVFDKNAIFRRKMAKIAENSDHNINPTYVGM
jgi:hypothetical protein